MTNNDPLARSKEKAALEAFFDRFCTSFAELANKYGLLVEKYWHDFPSWRFSFKHPLCGIACIEIMKEGENIKAYSYWWLDDYDRGIRKWRRYESPHMDVEDVDIEMFLNETLNEILSWDFGSWTGIKTGFSSGWAKAFSKREFEALTDNYQTLRAR